MAAPIVIGDPIRIVAPTALPLSLAELRAQCRLTVDDGTDEDALLVSYQRSAVEYAEQYTGLALITSTWRQTFSGFGERWIGRAGCPGEMLLRRKPLQSVVEVNYLDGDGVEQVLDPSVYRVLRVGEDKRSGAIRLGYSQTWPTIQDDAEAVTVTYKAGFGDDHNAVPEQIRHAIMLLVGYWYEQRTTALIDPIVVEVPLGTHALLREWRPLAVA